MRTSSITLWLTRLAWGLLLLDLILIFVVPTDASFGSLLLLIAYALWLILSLMAVSTWLIIRYRELFRRWPGWATPIVVLILSSMVFQGIWPVGHPNLSFFFTLLFVVSMWSVGVTTAILLCYNDVGLGMIAWGSAIMIWVLMLAWRFQGNLIELSFFNLIHPDERPPLWWFNPLFCVFGWIVPLSAVSFLGHTLRLILREWQSQ